MKELKSGALLKNGKYKIVKSIGQGSFGITYLATMSIEVDGQLGKIDVNVNVAIKEFFMSDLNSRSADGTSVEKTDSSLVKNYRTKFRREAENLSKLHHPNIVKVLEVFEENNTTYYVMEFIEGESLDDYIKRQGKLPEEEALSVAQNICSALSYMHGHKMLHLDLKPKNIMRVGEGNIRLIDFGLSKQYNENGEPESSTTLGLGTPGYAPIEQAQYKQDGTFPVTLDIYALGATLFKMLTGKTPPEATILLEDGFPSDLLKQAGVSADVTAIVEKAMAPMRKNRYQTVEALLKAISEIVSTNDDRTNYTDDEERTSLDYTIEVESETPKETVNKEGKENNSKKKDNSYSDQSRSIFGKYWLYGLVGILLIVGVSFLFLKTQNRSSELLEPVILTDADSIADGLKGSVDQKAPRIPGIKDEMGNWVFSITNNEKTVSFKMIKVEAGTFKMGSESGDSDEKPVHKVTLTKDYYIGETEVTQGLWETVMGKNPSGFKRGNRPVEYVTYEDCKSFLIRLNELTGLYFRLPTEAEWEYAAKGGNKTQGYTYAGSNSIDEVAWYDGNSKDDSWADYILEADRPVAQKQPNELGIYDMSGNVWEWCNDLYGSYSTSAEIDPAGPSSGTEYVLHGGSFYNSAKNCRPENRLSREAKYSYEHTGFRLAL